MKEPKGVSQTLVEKQETDQKKRAGQKYGTIRSGTTRRIKAEKATVARKKRQLACNKKRVMNLKN